MSGITNKDLEKLSRKFLNKNFLGVYPSDVLPNLNKKSLKSIIFNLSKHDEEGTHFIAIIKRFRKIIYFDSFGKKCENENILKYLQKNNLPLEQNVIQIQDNNSSLCGYYCFHFLYVCFLKKKSLQFFLKMYETKPQNLNNNDRKLLNYILKIIDK